MRKVVVLLALLVVALVASPAAATGDDDPFPAGACVRVTVVDPRPICVMIDPAD